MIAMGTLALLRDRAQLAALRDAGGPELLANGVEELLRYATVSHNARQRVAIADTVIGGQLIRAGEGVLIQIDSANRDETVFCDPDRLDIHRPPHRHFALGHGLHRCLGHALARVELQVVFESLLRRVPSLRLAVPIEQIPFKSDENLVGAHRLPVAW
jgi:cytochrome P450